MSLLKKQKVLECNTNESLFTESKKLITIENDLCNKLESLEFKSPIEYIYNPLKYAKDLHETFIKKYFEKSTKKILFLGMNPGPWGMCQTGIVFGERDFVKEWLKINGSVKKPVKEHPKRKVLGLGCQRSEISGKKFWKFFQALCGTPDNFFKHSFVYNLCPFAFMNLSGKNITPPEIKDATTKKLLNDACDEAFITVMREFDFEILIGIGKFAEQRAARALKSNGITNVKVLLIPHPSPRNAKNLLNWESVTFKILQDHNLIQYFNEVRNFSHDFLIAQKYDSNNANFDSEEIQIKKWMKVSLKFAKEALKNGEVPVGCIFIYDNEIIAKGANTVNKTKNATRHAEMNCIDQVLAWCKNKNLNCKQLFEEVEVVVTVEPCIMCSAALHELNIKKIIFGCGNYRFGGCSSVFDVPQVYSKSTCKIIGGIYEKEAITLLKKFYKGTNPNAPKHKVKKKNKESD